MVSLNHVLPKKEQHQQGYFHSSESLKPKIFQRILEEINNLSNLDENLFPKVIEAVRARCTIGEIINSMRDVFGDYQPPSGF